MSKYDVVLLLQQLSTRAKALADVLADNEVSGYAFEVQQITEDMETVLGSLKKWKSPENS